MRGRTRQGEPGDRRNLAIKRFNDKDDLSLAKFLKSLFVKSLTRNMPIRYGRFEMPKTLTKDESTATDTYAKFVAEPFEAGYGTPLEIHSGACCFPLWKAPPSPR